MKMTLVSACVASVIALVPAQNALAQEKVQAADLVEIFEKMAGKQPGFRKAHAKGVCVSATFSPSESKHFKEAKLLTSGTLPVSMRFSLGGGNPAGDDRAPGTRGMGMQINFPDGSMHVFTGNNFPAFLGKDPDTFYGFLKTLMPDESGKPNPMQTAEYIKNNPSVRANVAWNQKAETSASFANTEFFGLHTFFFDNAGEQTKFRWQLTPDLGVKTLNKEEAAKKPADFLNTTLAQQIAEQTVSFSLNVSIGKPEDTNVDPSSPWPDDRTKVKLGTVTLSSSGGEACKNTNFDPNILSAGFTPSEDPVLRMRSPAYAISFGKRLSNQ